MGSVPTSWRSGSAPITGQATTEMKQRSSLDRSHVKRSAQKVTAGPWPGAAAPDEQRRVQYTITPHRRRHSTCREFTVDR